MSNDLTEQSRNEVAARSDNAMSSFIERAASDQSVDIDKFERLIALQNAERERQAKMAYHADMAMLQSEIPVINKRGKIEVNKVVRSRYALYEDIMEAVKPLFNKYGFSFSAKTEFKDNMLYLTGIVSHKLGHTEETTMTLPFDNSGSKNSVQAVASSVSYGRRYVISMLLNISTGVDDDAASATNETISDEQAEEVKKILQETNANVKAFLGYVGANDVDSMTMDQYTKGKVMLDKKLKKSGAK